MKCSPLGEASVRMSHPFWSSGHRSSFVDPASHLFEAHEGTPVNCEEEESDARIKYIIP